MSGVLEQVDLMSREVGECADKVAKEVAARLDEVGGRLDAVRKKVRFQYRACKSERALTASVAHSTTPSTANS